jgi:predicted peroxiredoxin
MRAVVDRPYNRIACRYLGERRRLLVTVPQHLDDRSSHMSANGKVAITMTTGMEDPEQVTVALLTALGAAEQGRPTLMFMTKEAVRLTVQGVAVGTACDGCPPIADLMKRLEAAGGHLLACPICFNAKHLNAGQLLGNAELGGTVQLWEWIGDGATTFSF